MMKIHLRRVLVRKKVGTDGHSSLPPTTKASQTLHLHETESENTAESRSDHAEKVEDRVSLSHVVADIPGRQKVDAALEADLAGGLFLISQNLNLQGRSQPPADPRLPDMRPEQPSCV